MVERFLWQVVTGLFNYISYLRSKRQAVKAVIRIVSTEPIQFWTGAKHMATILTDLQKVALSVSFVDLVGNPAAVDGAPVWTSSDPTILTVEAAADGMTAVATTVGPLGNAQISVAADADLGAGVTTITGTSDFTVQSSQATTAAVGVGTPEDK